MKLIPGLIFVLLGLNWPLLSVGQFNRDSLMQQLQVAGEDSDKVMTLIRISDTYETNQQDSSLLYLEKARALAELLGFKKGLHHYYSQRSILSFTMGNYRQSMVENEQSLEMARAVGDSSLMLNALANTGIVYQYLGQFDKQLEVSLNALTLIEQGNYTEKLSGMYHGVGNAYFSLNQFDKCRDYCLRALRAYRQYGNNPYLNRVLATLGGSYDQMKVPDSALYYYKWALRESSLSQDTYAEASIYGFMANVYAIRSDFDSMLQVSEKSMELAERLQSRQLKASALYNLAYAHFFNQHPTEARQYITEALAIAEADSLQDELKNIYSILSYIAAGEQDFPTLVMAKSKSDSILQAGLNAEVFRKTAELTETFEAEKRDSQIKLQQVQLQNRNTLNYLLIGALLTFFLISSLAYRNYRYKQNLQKRRISELETEKQIMATEAVLRGEEQERTRLAQDLHDGLGGMLSGIKYSFTRMQENLVMSPENQQAYARGIDMLDSSIKEMRRVAHNLMPEALIQFGLDTALRDFCNHIHKSGALPVTYQSIGMENLVLEQTTATAIYRIVQELINNTLQHAGAKTALVQLSYSPPVLSVTVEDDGRGMDPSHLKASDGIGWANILNRVEFLKGNLDIHSVPEQGTSVHIEFQQ